MLEILVLTHVVLSAPSDRLSGTQATLVSDKRKRHAATEISLAIGTKTNGVPIQAESTSPGDAPKPDTWSAAEIADALQRCVADLAPLSADVENLPPVRSGQCGLPAPIRLKRIGAEPVTLEPPATINCAVANALDGWLKNIVQPAARSAFGSPVVRFAGTEGYVCRNRNGDTTARISEHAFGNAIDILAFTLADGRKIDIL
ncbi:MAG: extensin family protein, partial [Proteobacteria bacterium]|nr:extensin family protein [Pseudomonadota bacterium]